MTPAGLAEPCAGATYGCARAHDGSTRSLQAKPIGVVATAAFAQHLQAVERLVAMLVGLFAAYVVPPGLYAHAGDFGPHGEIVSPSVLKATVTLGQALVGLGYAIAASGESRAPEPQL